MPVFRVDIRVASDIVFPTADESVTVNYLDQYQIRLANGPEQDNKIVRSLDAVVIGRSDSMDEVGREFREILARWLDSLAYVCQCNFIITKVWRVVEWEPNLKRRKFKALNVLDIPPATNLSANIIATANTVAQSELPSFVRRALQCFRTALYLFSQEDRFMQFWTAVEVLADGSKERIAVAIPCPECEGIMGCTACGNVPTRIPMATQAIRALFEAIKVPDAAVTFKILSKVRHGITHGRTIQSIENETGKSIAESVQTMGLIACHAIRRFVPGSIFDSPPTFKSCGGRYSASELLGGPVGEFEQPDHLEFPGEEIIPVVEISIAIVGKDGTPVSNTKASSIGKK